MFFKQLSDARSTKTNGSAVVEKAVRERGVSQLASPKSVSVPLNNAPSSVKRDDSIPDLHDDRFPHDLGNHPDQARLRDVFRSGTTFVLCVVFMVDT
jgi:hypothetical protein